MSNIKTVLAVGCSFTYGAGLAQGSNDPNLWINQICNGKHICNKAKIGANNEWIFLEAVTAVRQHTYDLVIVGWSVIPRYNFHVGLELHSVETKLNEEFDINVNNRVTFTNRWLRDTGDRLRTMHNDHWDILNIVKYVNVLIELQEISRRQKILFVNTASPWCNDYFQKLIPTLPSDLDPYVQSLLQVTTRDDDEIFALYHMIHNHYQQYGGIQEQHWLNLYRPLTGMQIDRISDQDPHPGPLSQAIFTQYLLPILEEKLTA
jgi:hypothetical protein